MKKSIVFLFSCLVTLSLLAQNKSKASWWTGPIYANGSATNYEFQMRPEVKGGVVFEVETTVVAMSASFSKDNNVLTFKNSDGILVLNRLSNEKLFQDKKGYLRFKFPKQSVSYKVVKGKLRLPGWEEGVAALVLGDGNTRFLKD